MNKNNLKRIAVFMAMMATLQSRLSAKGIMPVVAYGGPEFFGERFKINEIEPIVEYGSPEFFGERFKINEIEPIVEYGGPGWRSEKRKWLEENEEKKRKWLEENEEKKGENNSSKIESKKFYKKPKIMVPVVIGSTTVLVSSILLSLWGAGIIGKKDKKEKKAPFDDYLKLVEKIKSGGVFGYCSGVANYNYTGKTFSPSFNGVDDNWKDKPEICKKLDAGLLTEFASSFVEIKSGEKWRLSTDTDSTFGRVEVTIFFNSVKKQYELKFLYASGNNAHKYSVKLDDVEKK